MLDIAETIRRVAPKAYFLNFTNPAGIITEALQSVLGDRALGICDTPSGLGRRVAGVLGYDHTRIQMDYVGLNHLGWMRRVLVDGVDVLPALLADDERLARMEETQVFGADWLRTLGCPERVSLLLLLQSGGGGRILESPQTRGDFLLETQPVSSPPPRATPTARRSCGGRGGRAGRRYMAEATGGPRRPAVDRAREPIPRTWVMPVWRSG